MNEWSNAKLCDVANLVLGVILLASPWIFGFPSGAASQNAVVFGIVIAAISIAALAAFTVWEEWLNLIMGVWVLVAPWVVGFAGTTAMYVHIVIGVIVAVLAVAARKLASLSAPAATHCGQLIVDDGFTS